MSDCDPRYVGPEIPGFVKVSNHMDATSEDEAIQLGAAFLKVPVESMRAIRFQPTGTPYWIWASYVDDKYSGRVAMHEALVRLMLDTLMAKAMSEDAEDWRRRIHPS